MRPVLVRDIGPIKSEQTMANGSSGMAVSISSAVVMVYIVDTNITRYSFSVAV